jgi:quercetin dioxygenase-like cupin family protein
MDKNPSTATVKTPSSNFTGDVWMNPVGLVGTRDGKTVVLRAGESVWTPAGEEHFHGGTTENMMCHYAILDASGDSEATTWLEPVTDEQYLAAHRTAGV